MNPDIGPINEIADIDIFVISPPKCATTSIQRGFERLGHKVLHAHNDLTTHDAFANGAILRRHGVGLLRLIEARQATSRRPAFFFCGYREVVAWYLSLAGQFGLPMTDDLTVDVPSALDLKMPWKNYSFEEPRRILEAATGLGMTGARAENGVCIQTKGRATLVFYRADRTDVVAQFIRSRIDPGFENRRERENADPAYAEFRARFRLPEPVLRRFYSDPVHAFFYKAEETETLVATYAA
ncbi:hypothetical protein [Polymorphum gilvum]|uniref:Sulfotransferase family protein n=1 Tax=Polymorphum gilvum (strain LMG 25793 / CGMCC 1.9160 / SL003B-26A1) TaxID=991905 RepID=F2J268_POLGS|nr:hypothetical protein [Polymorphum gilvum]ADZ68827.1 hypothetical protein SL003B_0392 [Polymorphum gilvum SL003B-26A1]